MTDFTDSTGRPMGLPFDRLPRIMDILLWKRIFAPQRRFVDGRFIEVTTDVAIDVTLDAPMVDQAVGLGLWVGHRLVPNVEATDDPRRARFVESEPEHLQLGGSVRLAWIGNGPPIEPEEDDSVLLPDIGDMPKDA
jgi:hypothetical protein